MKSLLASVYCYTRLPVLHRVCCEVAADHLSYTRHFSYLRTGFCHFSNMSKHGSPLQDEDILKEKEKFLNMSLDEKRNKYKGSTFFTVDKISTWQDYFLKSKERLKTQFSNMIGDKEEPADSYSVNPELNKKVSIWEGNITLLETDAIVNAANSRLCGGGGGVRCDVDEICSLLGYYVALCGNCLPTFRDNISVPSSRVKSSSRTERKPATYNVDSVGEVDGAIHAAAGRYLKAECATLGGCAVGVAKLTGGYRLPAKYVIHTVGPQGEKPGKLESCYRTSLEILIANKLRTVAFPCISTGVYGYPPEKAAHVALKTTRTFLEKKEDTVDRVVFCLYLKDDVKIYENLMQVYFPVGDLHNNL